MSNRKSSWNGFSLQFDVKALVEALSCPAVINSLMNLKSIRGPMSDERNLLHASCLVYIPSCPSSSLILSCRELSQLSAQDLKSFKIQSTPIYRYIPTAPNLVSWL